MVMSASRTGRTVDLTPGEQQRDYLYVGDVVTACLKLAVATPFPAGEIFNICSGRGIGLRALANAAVAAAGGDPTMLRWEAKPYRPAESMRVVGDPAKVTAAIGWHAITSLDAGMAMTAAADAAAWTEETKA
jgi:nucleoside-diphosphate-sugar epimerase